MAKKSSARISQSKGKAVKAVSKALPRKPKSIEVKKKAAKIEVAAKRPVHTAIPAAPATEKSQPVKKVSQALLATIEKRKKEKAVGGKESPFGRPAGRRGRRPKRPVEYQPMNNEDENYALETDYEGIEYDTGIRVKEGGDDGAFSMDRFEEFDEELNFDA